MARKSEPDKKPGQGPRKDTDLVPKDYEKFLGELKERIRTAQLEQRSRSTGSSSCFTGRLAGTSLPGKSSMAGGKGHRPPGWGPAARVSRNGRILPAKPQVHAGLCPSLA